MQNGGGTWELLQDSFLVGAGNTYTLGDEGGSATHIHKYGHIFGAWHYGLVGDTATTGALDMSNGSESTIGEFTHLAGYFSSNHPNTSGNQATGTFGGHKSIGKTTTVSNLPPYTAVNMWLRTA